MAKKKQEEGFEQDGEVIVVTDKSHLEPQQETAAPPRPKPVDESHAKPQEEVKEEVRKVKLADPKHAFPQE